MTEDRMALVELLQKSGDDDFLRAVAEAVLHILMEADVEGLIGAGRHERSADRLNYRRYHDAPDDVGRPARREAWTGASVSASVAQRPLFLLQSS
jgi:transposase-like protein